MKVMAMPRIWLVLFLLLAIAPQVYGASQNKSKKEMSVSVIKFGAKGDGVADDTAALLHR
ncbi:MAG: hypothetical protein Q7N50_00665 [Armatimonadota bacterium]|nr:hypothetical protein [Armatimonadota bacterium]